MAKSKIIKDLINNSIPLTQALDRLLVIAMELEDTETLNWIKAEKNGYNATTSVPEYRYVQLFPIGTYQMLDVGGVQTFYNHSLPTMGVPENIKNGWTHFPLKQSVAQLLSDKISYNQGKTVHIPLTPEVFSCFELGTNIRLTSAQLAITELDIDRILEAIKTKVLEMLVILEKNFGVLDALDINIEDYDKDELNKLKQVLDGIKNGKSSGDTYIISNSKIRNSNIGKNNSQEKKIATEISPTITVEKQKHSKGLLSKFKSLFSKKK